MEFACHIAPFEDKPLLDAFATIARMGFRYVDIGTGQHLQNEQITKDPRGTAAKINHLLETFHLKLSDVYLDLPRISVNDANRRVQEISQFQAMMPFVIALNTPGITLSPGLSHPEEDKEAFDRTVTSLREMIKIAEAATPATHLAVSIEPHINSMAPTADAAAKLVKQVKGLTLTLDWAQMVYQDVFFDDIVKLLPHTRHIHIRQAARAQMQTPYERGRIDVNRVVTALKAADYKGVVCVEYMTADDSLGALTVDPVLEAITLRDALRDARDAAPQTT